jgi:hypothetical protein
LGALTSAETLQGVFSSLQEEGLLQQREHEGGGPCEQVRAILGSDEEHFRGLEAEQVCERFVERVADLSGGYAECPALEAMARDVVGKLASLTTGALVAKGHRDALRAREGDPPSGKRRRRDEDAIEQVHGKAVEVGTSTRVAVAVRDIALKTSAWRWDCLQTAARLFIETEHFKSVGFLGVAVDGKRLGGHPAREVEAFAWDGAQGGAGCRCRRLGRWDLLRSGDCGKSRLWSLGRRFQRLP